ncbi:MAG: chemotaxis protein CheW [bacterium]
MTEVEYKKKQDTRCLMVPMSGDSLLVPNALVIEILNYRAPESAAKGKKDWYLGMINWRNLDIPLISFERMIGADYQDAGQRRRIMVCHSFSEKGDNHFLGLVAQGLPRLISLDEDAMSVLNSSESSKHNEIYSHVKVGDYRAYIPAMDIVGQKVGTA